MTTDDDLDLALTYDYNLAPASVGPALETVPLWQVAWGLGVPADHPDGPAKLADFADSTWIVNSRNTADEDAVRTLAAMAGFSPKMSHSHTRPSSCSSHESHVFHGVLPPEQFVWVPSRIR